MSEGGSQVRQQVVRLAIAVLLVLVPLALAIAMPIALGRRDETGLMVSWAATPVATGLAASAFAVTRLKRVAIAFVAGALLAATIGAITYGMWLTWAEEWMLQKRGIVEVMILASVVLEVVGGLVVTLALPTKTIRSDETVQ